MRVNLIKIFYGAHSPISLTLPLRMLRRTFNSKRLKQTEWNIHIEPHINKSTAIFSSNQINNEFEFGVRDRIHFE